MPDRAAKKLSAKKLIALFFSAVFSLFLVHCVSFPLEQEILIAEQGQACISIVLPDNYSAEEHDAAFALRSDLTAVTGAIFAVVTESQFRGDCAFYVGSTRYAQARGIGPGLLDKNEIQIRSFGKDIVISAGWGQKLPAAVSRFSQKYLQCRNFAWDTESHPVNSRLVLQAINDRWTSPFSHAEIYTEAFSIGSNKIETGVNELFLRNGLLPEGSDCANGQTVLTTFTPHTFYQFLPPSRWFSSHPEYFSMNEKGERFVGNPEKIGASGSSLCLSNPDVVGLVTESIQALVSRELEDRGLSPDAECTIDLSVEDNAEFICKCPECSAISDSEGSESGLLLSFVNTVARSLKPLYPALKIRTLAYGETQTAPLHIRPEDNVIIWWADSYGQSDCFRPLTHPINSHQLKKLKDWAAITKHLQIWDYWNMGLPSFQAVVPEFVPVETIAEDLRLYSKLGAEGLMVEYEWGAVEQSFYQMNLYCAMQLIKDPEQPIEPLIDSFMMAYYGEAKKPIKQYYELIKKALYAEKEPMFALYPPSSREYLNPGFLMKCRSLLTAAEDKTPVGSKERIHVLQELAVVDNCMVYYFDRFSNQDLYEIPFIKKQMIEAFLEDMQEIFLYNAREERYAKDLITLSELLRAVQALPELIHTADKKAIFDLTPAYLPQEQMLQDKQACTGYAVTYFVKTPSPEDAFDPFFGLYDRLSGLSSKPLRIKPVDENYHWYSLGKFPLGKNTIIYGHWSWEMTCALLDRYYLPIGPSNDPAKNRYEVFISAKFTGPLYVNNSTQPNAIFVDRIVLVAADK
jgi:hypothetical protein